MSVATSKYPVSCPQCGKQLMVPATAAGKQGRCPSCTHVFVLPAVLAQPDLVELPQLAPLSSDPFAQSVPTSDYQLQPTTPGSYAPTPGSYPYSPTPAAGQGVNPHLANAYANAQATQNAEKYNHGMGLEQRGWDMGMVGGLLMMVIAVVWFFGAGFFGIWFIYPPILFVIGLVGFLRGLFTGNVAGRDD